ncbi:MAG: ATP-grasp domain-containing protein [Bacteroidales bacterium]|nr:ATP-grasp domain-containing protein [Bacteroidales bacterium]
MKKRINVAVTGLNAIDSPGPGIAVIRALREASSFDVRITGLAYESLEPGIYMHDLIEKTYHIPYPSSGTKNLMERLAYIHEKEKLDVIVPNFDAELFPLIKVSDELASMGIKTFLPTLKQFEERQKINLVEFGKKYGIKVPFSRAILSHAEIPGLKNDFTYPVVVKGKYYDAKIAYTEEQVRTFFTKISNQWGLPIIIQQFIKGNEYNVTGLGDGQGATIAAVPMRKQYITDKGKAWGGISIADDKILEMTKKFIKETQWRGGFELELMKDAAGDYILLEINPRMPAWIYLSVGAGQNIPEALVNLALSREVKPFETYQVGKMFIRYSWDMIVDVSEFHQISTLGEL